MKNFPEVWKKTLFIQTLITAKIIRKKKKKKKTTIFLLQPLPLVGKKITTQIQALLTVSYRCTTYQFWDEMLAVQLQEKVKSDSCPGNLDSEVLGD